MPIKPENKARYPKNWSKISLQIRERDNHQCCFCGVDNGAVILRYTDEQGKSFYKYRDFESYYCADTGEYLESLSAFGALTTSVVTIVLTVAHLDHTPENCDPSNLKSLCQRCHLKYDAAHHAQTRAQTKQKVADNQTSLF